MRDALWQFLGALAAASILSASPAMGQTAQTWVSSTGTPNGLCSRTQPCRTFSQAYGATLNGGQIQVLDSGSFGGQLDIKKSITIKAVGALGSIVVTGYNGLVIDAPADARIVIEGLDIDGGRDGAVGILILGGGQVVVRNTTIRNFSSAGIYINNLVGRGRIFLTVDNARINNAEKGIWVSTLGDASTAYVWNSVIVGSGMTGIQAVGPQSRVEISGNVINRTPQSLHFYDGAAIASYGDNVLSDGDAPSSVLKK
ncbi:right-handed parallel beta-helix repeat-containing protein [Ramlibacter sp. WS9]|uniref:right-handed parallel beta-helix repeat-containing protein n=1 Tax=Ramlibacter sp. WS9 TaxID=1882741 RepID=UPI0011425B20|nr:right-handed parallel beta-helix repeat-containing protein [Ramlibacter sp. WS9]ROZ69375.1 right-handed parallel beta-helix repeat-containing protein [Ramlibacter sp. WS9]